MKTKFTLFLLTLILCSATFKVQAQKNIMTVIHSDVKGGSVNTPINNQRFNNLKNMVDTATSLGVKLTMMLNPYFCEIILNDPTKFNQVQTWQANGHEIAGLHRGLTHNEWDGYTDLPADSVNLYNVPNGMADYIGPMSTYFNWLDSISINPINLFSTYDIVSEFDWKPSANIQGTGDGMSAIPSSGYFNVTPSTVNQGNVNVCQVYYYFIDSTTNRVNDFISLYTTQSEQNVGSHTS